MVGDREGIASLSLTASDLLFYLSESGFNFPARTIEFDDLLHGQSQVRGHQCEPLVSPEFQAWDQLNPLIKSENLPYSNSRLSGNHEFATRT